MKHFKEYFLIPAPPEEVYLALTNPIAIELWTGEHAEMSTQPGSEFSLWNGAIVGKNLAFEEGKKIEQEWYFGNQAEPSIVTILLHPHKKGTSMEVKQVNIPNHDFEDIVDGWHTVYFPELKNFYEEE